MPGPAMKAVNPREPSGRSFPPNAPFPGGPVFPNNPTRRHMRLRLILPVVAGALLNGCSHYPLIRFEQAEKTDFVTARLATGKTVRGSVVKADPFQLSILQKDRQTVTVQRDAVLLLRRRPPVTDEFGKGISEEEIVRAMKSKNAVVYGLGGGALSFGFSFFAGSMIGRSSQNGTALLAGTTAAGTLAGTLLFIRAGKARDRKESIESIRLERRNAEAKPGSTRTPQEQIRQLLESERKKEEDARLRREELLRELEKSRSEEKPNHN